MYEEQPGDPLILRLFVDADLRHDQATWPRRFEQVQQVLADHGFEASSTWQQGAHARISGAFCGDVQQLSYAVEELDGVEIFSAGHSLEIKTY